MIILLAINFLTVSRILLSGIFAYEIFNKSINMYQAILLFTVICATDFFDGKIARKYCKTTKFGAVLDISADFFFILTSYPVFFINGIFPAWILLIAILKIFEFLITSFIIGKNKTVNKNILFFDRYGSIAAILFFILPLPGILLNYNYHGDFISMQFLTNFIFAALIIITCYSSIFRINICINIYHLKFKTICIKPTNNQQK